MRIDRVGKTNAPAAPAPARAAASSGSGQAFNDAANDALAKQIEEDLFGPGGSPAGQKQALVTPIEDIAARASVNFVSKRPKDE